MLVGYVSDERHVALADVLVEFDQEGEIRSTVRSTARGAIEVNLRPGSYRVTLVKDGFGSRGTVVTVEPGRLHAFRLLSDGLLGYAWPKWVRSGERAEIRLHSVESCRVSLWRYGLRKEQVRLLGWFDEHGPRALVQVTPDG